VNKTVRIFEGEVFDPDIIPFTNSMAEEAAPVDPAVAQRQAAAAAQEAESKRLENEKEARQATASAWEAKMKADAEAWARLGSR